LIEPLTRASASQATDRLRLNNRPELSHSRQCGDQLHSIDVGAAVAVEESRARTGPAAGDHLDVTAGAGAALDLSDESLGGSLDDLDGPSSEKLSGARWRCAVAGLWPWRFVDLAA